MQQRHVVMMSVLFKHCECWMFSLTALQKDENDLTQLKIHLNILDRNPTFPGAIMLFFLFKMYFSQPNYKLNWEGYHPLRSGIYFLILHIQIYLLWHVICYMVNTGIKNLLTQMKRKNKASQHNRVIKGTESKKKTLQQLQT